MVDDALAPFAAHGGVLHPGEDVGILLGDAGLIEVAVQRPGLDLAARAFAGLQAQLEGVQMVVARLADLAQAALQLFRGHEVSHSVLPRFRSSRG